MTEPQEDMDLNAENKKCSSILIYAKLHFMREQWVLTPVFAFQTLDAVSSVATSSFFFYVFFNYLQLAKSFQSKGCCYFYFFSQMHCMAIANLAADSRPTKLTIFDRDTA